MAKGSQPDPALLERLDAIEEKLDVILTILRTPGAAGAAAGYHGQQPAGGPSEAVLQFIRAGRLIDAIKQFRTETGAGLKEAKDAVEQIRDSLPGGRPGPAGGDDY